MEAGNAKQDRKLYIDLLRIVACFSVIMLHCASQYWYDFSVNDPRWLVYNSWDAVSRFGVPVFVMISGMLFLSREGQPDVRRLYRNNILRLAVAYFVWCVIYGLWDCSAWFGAEGVTLRDYAAEMVLGRYHLWFVPMLIGIYMLLPVLKTFTDHCSKKTLEYFLLLFLILQIGRSTLAIIRIPALVNVWVSLLDVELACSYVGYFVIGYYLYRYRLSEKACRLLFLASALSLVLAAIISCVTAVIYQEPRAEAFDSYSVFTMLVSVAVFVFLSGEGLGMSMEGKSRSCYQRIIG